MARVTFTKLSDGDKTPFDELQISSPAYPVPPTNTSPKPSATAQQPPLDAERLPFGLFDWSRLKRPATAATPRYTVALLPHRPALDATRALISRYATLEPARRVADYLNAHPEPLPTFTYPQLPE